MYAYQGATGWTLMPRHDLSPDEIKVYGAVEIVEDKPDGWWPISAPLLRDEDGVPHMSREWEPWSIQGSRLRAHQARDTAFKMRIEAGYHLDIGKVSETLQTGDADDKVSLLKLQFKAERMVRKGKGEDIINLPIRCASGRTYKVTYAQALKIMDAVDDWYDAMRDANWKYEHQIDTCESQDAMDEIVAALEAAWAF